MTPPVALLAAVVLAVALVLLLRRLAPPARRRRDPGPNWIAVDGSNVMYWDAALPRIETVRAVTDDLRRRGFVPVVWFDANAGHHPPLNLLANSPFRRSGPPSGPPGPR